MNPQNIGDGDLIRPVTIHEDIDRFKAETGREPTRLDINNLGYLGFEKYKAFGFDPSKTGLKFRK